MKAIISRTKKKSVVHRARRGAWALGLLLATTPLRAQCPDEVAEPREAVQHNVLGGETCWWTLLVYDQVIPGQPIECPQAVIEVPAHSTCEPAPGSGKRCFVAGEVPVRRTTYECSEDPIQVGAITLIRPRCVPGEPEVIGYLPDAADADCDP